MAEKRARNSAECARLACGQPATLQVALRVWALGTVMRLPDNCCNILMNWSVCRGCAELFTADDLLTAPIKEKIAHAIMHECARAVPDFSSAVLNLLPIVDRPVTAAEFAQGRF